MMNILLFLLFELFVCIASQSVCPPGSELGLNNTCVPCQPGSATDTTFDSEFCSLCDSGTFQPLSGQTSCLPCPAGTESVFGATMCGACLDGQAVFRNGTCGECPPGEELDQFGPGCFTCRDGFFKAGEGPGPCLPCPPGAFAMFEGTECVTCPENQAPVMADGTCGQCPPGSFFREFDFSCAPCFSGTFTNVLNVLNQCFLCGGNSFALSGATECISCPIGQVFLNSTQSCEPDCEPGFFYNGFDLECEICRVNQFSSGGKQRFCDSCSAGSFARAGSSTCFLCPLGQSFIEVIDDCGVCPEDAPYDSFTASCEFDRTVVITPLPEPNEEE